jgi:hypothetical protein
MVATPINTALPASPSIPTIEWVQPPHDFVLDDTPVENNGQPLIAGALKESLELTGRLPASGLIAINFGLCARIAGELTLKAPDWLYISKAQQQAEAAQQQADREKQRADRLAEILRAQGLDPDAIE